MAPPQGMSAARISPPRPARYVLGVSALFIAYPREAKTLAQRLELCADAAGLSTFLAASQLKHDEFGEPLTSRIHAELDRSSHMLVVYSESARGRPWVHYEVGYARGCGVEPMIFVPCGRKRLLDGVIVQGLLDALLADLKTRGFGTTIGRLVAGLDPEGGAEFLTTGLIQLANVDSIWRSIAAETMSLPDYFFDLPLRLSEDAVVRCFAEIAAGNPGAMMERVASTDSPSQRLAHRLLAEAPGGVGFGRRHLPHLPTSP